MHNLNVRFLAAAFAITLIAFASPPANAEIVDLTAAGPGTGTITGCIGGTARFDFMTQQPTGTGVIKPFLRVQNTPTEQGYNTSGVTPKAPFDDKAGIWTHDLKFADLLATSVTGIDPQNPGAVFFKLLLDVNEPNGRKSKITLDQLEFYTSNICSQTTTATRPSVLCPGGTEVALVNATLRWSFKPPTVGTASTDMVLLDAARNSGSGSGDMYAYIPADAFTGTAPTDCVYMYVLFGAHSSADLTSAGGFEEWALVLNPQPTPTPTPTVTPTPTPPGRPNLCDPTAANADACYPFFTVPPGTCFSGHAIWMPGLQVGLQAPPCDPSFGAAAGTDGNKFTVQPSANIPVASFVEDASGNATLTAHVQSSFQNAGFDMVVQFNNSTTTPCPGNPVLELCSGCYVAPFNASAPNCTGSNCGCVDPNTWHYYSLVTGTLTGTGNYAGAVVTLTPAMMGCFQVGNGASGKNVDYGFSGWFDYQVDQQPSNPNFVLQFDGRTADINMNCENLRPEFTPTPTPTPKTKGKGPK